MLVWHIFVTLSFFGLWYFFFAFPPKISIHKERLAPPTLTTASRVSPTETTAEMPPKKKGNKKNQQDDWEAELGESITPPANANGADGDANANDDDDDAGGAGGLMATLRKNKEKRKKKGIVEPEPVPEPEAPAAEEPPAQAPVEANIDDEFALPEKKGKGGKQNKQAAKKPEPAATDDAADGGRILTKAEKEKLKKEREKQRKKEQVCYSYTMDCFIAWFYST